MDIKKIVGKALVFVGAFAGAKLAQKGVEKYIDKPEQDDWDDDYEAHEPTDEEIEKIVTFEEKEDEEKTDD